MNPVKLPTALTNALLDIHLIAEMARMPAADFLARTRDIAVEHDMVDEWLIILLLFARQIMRHQIGKAVACIQRPETN